MTTFYVYAIGHDDHLVEPYDNCYIGVSKNLRRRWSEHKCSNRRVGYAIRSLELVRDKHMIVLYEGTDKECLDLENRLRPNPDMGLNMSKGGFGGDFFKDTSECKSSTSTR